MLIKPLVIVTDLDGTLLDHHDYSYSAAQEALDCLNKIGIPIILNSSKTAKEISSLRKELGNQEPYIVENGGGIFIPFESTEKKIDFGMNRADILMTLMEIRKETGFKFSGFNDMTVKQLITCTGLSEESAKHALMRDYSEPLLWEDSELALERCQSLLEKKGLSMRRGGRFVHVAAPVTKASAFPTLREYFQSSFGESPLLVALGDAENDIDMLEAADFPILIPSCTNSLPKVFNKKLRIADSPGPAGWNTAILALLDELGATQN